MIPGSRRGAGLVTTEFRGRSGCPDGPSSVDDWTVASIGARLSVGKPQNQFDPAVELSPGLGLVRRNRGDRPHAFGCYA